MNKKLKRIPLRLGGNMQCHLYLTTRLHKICPLQK